MPLPESGSQKFHSVEDALSSGRRVEANNAKTNQITISEIVAEFNYANSNAYDRIKALDPLF